MNTKRNTRPEANNSNWRQKSLYFMMKNIPQLVYSEVKLNLIDGKAIEVSFGKIVCHLWKVEIY